MEMISDQTEVPIRSFIEGLNNFDSLIANNLIFWESKQHFFTDRE